MGLQQEREWTSREEYEVNVYLCVTTCGEG